VNGWATGHGPVGTLTKQQGHGGEGFGVPLIEGARKKLPIIAREIPVFREAVGDSAFYFDGASSEALASPIRT
jgi:glycosyltransferase involved in cell wall biosynthesis